MNFIAMKRAVGINMVALAIIANFYPHHAEGARLYFKNGDYIDGRRVYEKRGNVCLEVVRGGGGTIIFGRDEVDLDRTMAATAKVRKKAIRHHDEEQSGSDEPIVFSDAATHVSVQPSISAPPDTKEHEMARSQATVQGQPGVKQQDASQRGGLTVQIQGGGQVGYMRTVSEQEKGTLAKSQDSTRYYGRIEKDGTALFTNSEGKSLRGYIGDDGVGSVMDEHQKMIKIEPRQ